MTDLSKSDNFFLPDFSHIYVEEGAENFPMTDDILKRLPSAEAVSVQDYKSVFNRSGQDFQAQKKSMKLILAVKKDGFLYEATDVVQDAGYRNRDQHSNRKMKSAEDKGAQYYRPWYAHPGRQPGENEPPEEYLFGHWRPNRQSLVCDQGSQTGEN